MLARIQSSALATELPVWITSLSLKSSDVRIDERTLTIADENGFVDNGSERRSAKSSRTRHIPIHQRLLTVLQSVPRQEAQVYYHLNDEESRRKLDQLTFAGSDVGRSDV